MDKADQKLKKKFPATSPPPSEKRPSLDDSGYLGEISVFHGRREVKNEKEEELEGVDEKESESKVVEAEVPRFEEEKDEEEEP